MNTILITNALLDDKLVDVEIEGNRITKILPHSEKRTGETYGQWIDATGMALLPPFYNTHTHAAMTLLRGYADDMPLFEWLNNYIWPAESQLTEEDIRAGVRLAVLEMIKSGTVFFSDMYWQLPEAAQVVKEMGIRAALGVTFIESMGPDFCRECLQFIKEWEGDERIELTVAPHAIYTVGPELLRESAALAREKGLKLHIHLSETHKEVEDCMALNGMSPVAYLDQLGVLGPNVIAAHAVHLMEDDLPILAKRGVVLSHCPCSNMKLSSGVFPMQAVLEAGCKVTLGTDGCSSNNNLDMREEMKFAALLAKVNGSPQTLSAKEILRIATREGALAFGIDAGVIEEGRLADLLLVRLDDSSMVPCYNLISNWVYSANTSLIDTVICDGRILMRGRYVEGEEQILAEACR